MDKKPSLMIAIADGLKKKGKMKGSPEMEDDSMEGSDEAGSSREHLEQISKELIAAVKDEDHMAVADLLEEAFECLEGAEHEEEGPVSSKY